MFVFAIFVLLSVQTITAEIGRLPGPPKPFQHFNINHNRGITTRDWSPFKSASPKTFDFQGTSFTPPPKPPELPVPASPQYSSPWRPISNLDHQRSGYHHDGPRQYPEYRAPLTGLHQPPVQQTPLPPPIPNSPPVNHFPVQPPFDETYHHQNHFGGPKLENPHQPGFNQYQNDNHLQHPQSSYDVPLYAPMYEPSTNEDYIDIPPIDWSALSNVLGDQYPPPAPQTQRPPNHRYKIVFIKTPRIPGFQPPTTPPPPQDHEKTLIYVLVNKPDYDPATTPSPPPTTTPSKPEVYFISYKTKPNQSQTDYKNHDGNAPVDTGLYERRDMNQQRYGTGTISKSVEVNALN